MTEILYGGFEQAYLLRARADDTVADRLRTLDSASQLMLAQLKALAADCQQCGGSGELREPYECHVMTDHPGLIDPGIRPRAFKARARVEREGPTVVNYPYAAAYLFTPCAACADIRAVIDTAEEAL